MPDPSLFGVFKEEISHGVGEPFKQAPPFPKLSRHGGKQFVTTFPKRGALPDCFIDKNFKRLSQGQAYADSPRAEKSMQETSTGSKVNTKPFVPSNPAHKSTGPGGIDGCIGTVILSPEGEKELIRGLDQHGTESRRKIYTSPSQKGGFGYSLQSRTIGGNPPQFMPDPYQPGRQMEKVMKKKARDRISRPFISTSKADKIFWENPYGTTPGPDRKGKKVTHEKKTWKPNNPPKQGAPYCTISNVGRDYQPEPLPFPKYQEKIGGLPPFKPTNGSKNRLSMLTVNPYDKPARNPPHIDFTIL